MQKHPLHQLAATEYRVEHRRRDEERRKRRRELKRKLRPMLFIALCLILPILAVLVRHCLPWLINAIGGR